MSKKGSVFQKGGGGTNFEQSIQTAFLTTLIIRGNAPCIPTNEIIEVAFQTTNRGYETDDLLVIAKSSIGQHRLLAQIKNNLTFSINNDTFKEVISAFWKDYNNTSIFDRNNDRLLIIKSGLTKDEKNHISSILNWAKTHSSETDFISEVKRIKIKNDRLDIFRISLKEANNDIDLTDKEVWEFLKCLDVLEYDFLNEGSIDETYFLNLIKLSKNNSTTANEKEIWSSIARYVSKLNKDGGSVSIDSIQKEELYKYFDNSKLNPFFKSIEKLRSDSEVVLKPIKNTIDGFHIKREGTSELVIDSINSSQFTIITGKPGVGKSAVVKDVLNSNYFSESVFVFRADQFNSPHIANVFSQQGVSESIQDLFSCIALIPQKIIVIDSLEKLLEGDPENAFKQLLTLLKDYSDIKVITSVRKYAVDLIIQKFGIEQNEFNSIEIPELNDDELRLVSDKFPQLVSVFENQKIKALLKSPKYLDFALKSLAKESEDLSSISITGFKKKLWNNIIEDTTTRKNGLARKRNQAFLNIAIKRAKEMRLFVEPDDNLEEGIEALERDEVLFQEKGEYKFSPTHDILEDWALIRYIDSKHTDFPSPKILFNNLGNEPAVRRAFRLWIEDNLAEDNEKINELINDTFLDDSIENYWADEVLIAIFKSQNSSTFFNSFHDKLIENDGELLNRSIHIIRTTCKESNNASLLLPVGSGWTETIFFIEKNIHFLEKFKLSIVNLLLDWEYKLLFLKEISQLELYTVKNLIIYFLNQIESGDDFWQAKHTSGKKEGLIRLLFNLADISKDEITKLVERSISVKERSDNWELNSFYKDVLSMCLSGLDSHRLVKELPELVVSTAWHEWKLKLRENNDKQDSRFGFILNNRLRDGECWGISEKRSFFPSGVYKTPINILLSSHPIIGLKFITEFINYSIEFYVNAECEYKHKVEEIEIKLTDGTTKKQWAAWELWVAYRGLSVTHYALESILMSLEKFIIETARLKSETSRENTQFIFNYLLKNSNNVAISGLLTSVAIAYPEEVGKEMLPLLTVKEFYHWDSSRSLQEHSALSPMDDSIFFAQNERHRLNQLPHRKKHRRGLSDFIIDYQFNIRIINKDIHEVFDRLKEKSSSEDVLWKKILTEIDVRNHEFGKYDKDLGGFPVQPRYDDDVADFISSSKKELDTHTNSLNYSGKIWKAYDKKDIITFEYWLECFEHYSDEKNRNSIYDRPVSLASIGLRDFNKGLNADHINWCANTILETNTIILHDTLNSSFGLNLSYNLMEKEISIKALHLVYSELESEEDKSSITELILSMLIAPYSDYEVDYMTEYFRDIFFKIFPNAAKRICAGLIECAKFKKTQTPKHLFHDNHELEKALEEERKLIKKISSMKSIEINIDNIDFNTYDANLLAKTLIIMPFYSNFDLFHSFILKLIPLITNDLRSKRQNSYDRIENPRQIHSRLRLNIRSYLSELLFVADTTLSKQVLDLILIPIHAKEQGISKHIRDDVFEFCLKIPESSIYNLDKIISNSDDKKNNEEIISNFWILWEYLFERIKDSKKPYLINILLLGIDWKTESNHWKALENSKDLYKKFVLELGQNNTKSIIKLFSTAGDKTFLPEGIIWLTSLLKENKKEVINLISPSGERLVKRLFYHHILKIKSNKLLIDNYVWLLNHMVDLGSSDAYLFRENVITYKNNG